MLLQHRLLLFILTLLLCACGYKAPKPDQQQSLSIFDPGQFKQGKVYTILPHASEILIKVYRSGKLAAFGHNHIISTNDIQGKIFLHQNAEQSGFTLKLPVSSFVVDRQDYRKIAGEAFASVPSENDIKATFNNMLSEQVLNAALFPNIEIVSITITPIDTFQKEDYQLLLRISLHGVNRNTTIPVHLKFDQQKLFAEGEFKLRQSDFGIKPFSILFGTIAVQDSLEIHYRIEAHTKA